MLGHAHIGADQSLEPHSDAEQSALDQPWATDGVPATASAAAVAAAVVLQVPESLQCAAMGCTKLAQHLYYGEGRLCLYRAASPPPPPPPPPVRLRISPTVRWLPSIGFSDADAMAATEANAPPAPTPTPHSPSPEALQAAAKSYAPRDVKARVILVLDPGQVTFLAGYLVTKDGTYHPRSAFFFCLSVQLMERYEEASGISMMLFSWAYKQVRWAMIAAWSELTTDSGGGGGDDPTRCGCRRS